MSGRDLSGVRSENSLCVHHVVQVQLCADGALDRETETETERQRTKDLYTLTEIWHGTKGIKYKRKMRSDKIQRHKPLLSDRS